MKSKYKGKAIRTSGWETQPDFDNLLSDLDISSLRFLKHDYNKKIRDFGNQRDLHDEGNVREYQELLQRKKMITQELEHRSTDLLATPDYMEGETYFNPNTGLVINTNKGPLYSISFNEEETDYVYNDDIEKSDDTEYKVYKVGKKIVGYSYNSDRDLSDIYQDWNYYEDIND